MDKLRVTRYFLSLVLTLTIILAFIAAPVAVTAQDEEPGETTPSLTMECNIPSYSDDSGETFNYSCTMEYDGDEKITVNFDLDAPQGWYPYIQYSGKQVSSIDIGPGTDYGPDSVTFSVYLAPMTSEYPEPGDYNLTVTGTSGDLNFSETLTANVKAKYDFKLTTETGNLATKATSGKENHFTFDVVNNSSVEITNVVFNISKPSNWVVSTSPDKITSLGSGQTQQVDLIITPPEGKTVAGDYMITIKASSEKVNDSMDVRVTVETPSIWGWVGIIIIAVVIIGLIVLFMKMGRR
jgi:uncharacterized membrane protein